MNTACQQSAVPGFDPLWEELERMAQAASAQDAQVADEYPSAETISRWKCLFGYSHIQATHLIIQQRADLTRERITDEHWALIRAEKEAASYDREAYEHSLQLVKTFKDHSATIPLKGEGGETALLFRLGGLLDSAEKIQQIAGLDRLPKVVEGTSDMGVAKFCVVDKQSQRRLEEWLTQQSVLQR